MSVLSRLQARPVRDKRALNLNRFSPSTIVRRNPASQGRRVLGVAPPQSRLHRAAGRGRRQPSVSGRLATFRSLGKFGFSQVRRSARQSGRRAAAYSLIPLGIGAAAIGQESKRSRKRPALLGVLAAAGLVAVAKRDRVVTAIDRRRSAGSAAGPTDAPDPAPASVGSAETTTKSGQAPS